MLQNHAGNGRRVLFCVAALALLALAHLGLRAHGLRLPMMSDEGEYACQARLLSEGGVPYRDAYNQKPPLVFFLYRASFALFGTRETAPRLLAVLFCWATLLALFLLVPARWGTAARLCAPALFAVLSTAPVGDFGFAANTEVFLCAWLAFAAWATRRTWEEEGLGWPLLAGLLCGAALCTKQTALWAALLFGGAAALQSPAGRRTRSAALFALGAAALPVVFGTWFALRGGLADLVEQALRRNLDYASLLTTPQGLRMQFAWLGGTLAPKFLAGAWPLLLLALVGLCGRPQGEDAPLERLFVLWLAASALGALTGLFLFPHYFLQLLPPLALCAALGIRRLRARRPAAAALAAVLAALYPVGAWAKIYAARDPETTARRLLYPNPLYEARALADRLKTLSSPGDRLYVFGSEPQLYFRSGLPWATRHIFVYPLTLFPRAQEGAAELARLQARPPRFFVYSTAPASTLVASSEGRRFAEGVRSLLAKEYRPLGSVQALPDGMRESFPPAPGPAPVDALLLYERSTAGAP